MVSRRAKIGIALVAIVIVALLGTSAAVYYSQQNSAAGIFARLGAPSDQQIEAQIAQASSDPEMDRLWNKGLNLCMEIYNRDIDLYKSQCDDIALTGDRNSDCEQWEGKLLICNQNSALGQKFQSYLNVIGYP